MRKTLNMGSAGCLRAVGSEWGLIGGDCEPDPQLVGVECGSKTPLVCEPVAKSL